MKLGTKIFQRFILEKAIIGRIEEMSLSIEDKHWDDNPVLLVVLKGSFVFAADLLRRLPAEWEIHFCQYKSYDGTEQKKGKVLVGIPEDIDGRNVILIEDIVETGSTISKLAEDLESRGCKTDICTLLHKPSKYRGSKAISYIGFRIGSQFVVGYGLDYNEQGRGLRDIYKLRNSNSLK